MPTGNAHREYLLLCHTRITSGAEPAAGPLRQFDRQYEVWLTAASAGVSGLGVNRLLAAIERIAAGCYAVEVILPHQQIDPAGAHRRVGHAELFGVLGDGAPAEIGMDDVGGFVQFEEFKIGVLELEQLAPTLAL